MKLKNLIYLRDNLRYNEILKFKLIFKMDMIIKDLHKNLKWIILKKYKTNFNNLKPKVKKITNII